MAEQLPLFNWRQALRGGLVYASGDSVATLLLDQFQWSRVLGILLIGATLYAFEINTYFRWLENRYHHMGLASAIKKAIWAQAFFNPLWIARHLAFIALFSGHWAALDWHLLTMAVASFLHLVPIGLCMNYLIQNRIRLPWRFFASALYSAVTAIYLALSEVLFG